MALVLSSIVISAMALAINVMNGTRRTELYGSADDFYLTDALYAHMNKGACN